MPLKILVLIFLSIFAFQVLFAQSPTHKFMVTGYGFTNLEKEENEAAQYEVGFNPIFLYSIDNRFFFESEVEFELEEEGTDISLEYAQLFYVFNKYITFGAGKFLSPNNAFFERLHPAWINKLASLPFGVSGHGGVQLLAGTQLGLQVRAGIPVGPTKLTYALYVSNGPALNIDEEDSTQFGKGATGGEEGGHGHGVGASGTLNFNNIPDNNKDKAVGGHVAIFILPELEIGYGFETARVGTDGTEFENVRSFNNVVDLAFVKDVNSIKGRLDIRGQFISLNIDNPGIPPLEYENNSTSWFGQLAYQPSHVNNSFFKNIEVVGRYDQLNLPKEAELNVDQKRVAVGLNYWLNHSSVFKFTLESLKSELADESETESRFIFQFAMGF